MNDPSPFPELPPDFTVTGTYVDPQTGGVVVAGTTPGPLPSVAEWHAQVTGDVVASDRWIFNEPPADIAAAIRDGFTRIWLSSQQSLLYIGGASTAAGVLKQLPAVQSVVSVDTTFYVLRDGLVSYSAQHAAADVPPSIDVAFVNNRALAVAVAEALRRLGQP